MIKQHTQIIITCWTIHNIIMGLNLNPPMKDAPFLPFRWIWKVVNYFVYLKVKVHLRDQVTFINVNFIWSLWQFWFWFILSILRLISLLTPRKMNTRPIFLLLGAEIYGRTSNSSALYFSGFIHAYTIDFINHYEIIYFSLYYRACYECICR